MKVLIIGDGKSAEERAVLDHLKERCQHELHGALDQRTAESRDGVGAMEAYGVVSTPAVIVTRDDGSVVAMWQYSIPDFSEVSYYYHT